jgi:hypothetical protein
LKNRLKTDFKEKIGFLPFGRHIIVNSSEMDPCLYSIATLKGFVLRDIDITKAFAAMIKRKVLNLKEENDDNDDGDDDQFPFTPEKLLKNIDKGPLPDLCKVISLALKITYATNNCGYTITKSKNLATKV